MTVQFEAAFEPKTIKDQRRSSRPTGSDCSHSTLWNRGTLVEPVGIVPHPELDCRLLLPILSCVCFLNRFFEPKDRKK